MGKVYPDVRALGAELVVVGNGSVGQAHQFYLDRALPFPLYTDPSLVTYEAAGMKRGMLFGRKSMRQTFTALRSGNFQGATQGDAFQQGGAHVIFPGNKVAYSYISEVAGDHVDPGAALAVLSAGPPIPSLRA